MILCGLYETGGHRVPSQGPDRDSSRENCIGPRDVKTYRTVQPRQILTKAKFTNGK